MSDLPPADWYTDPEDESQYRYWDGSTWTEHRAPRHAAPAEDQDDGPDGMRGPWEVLGDTFSIARRRWRGCGLIALISLTAQVVMLVLFAITANAIVMGELGEILDRVYEPERLDTPETEAYFESLEFDFSPINFLPAALALLILWLVSNITKAAVIHLAMADLTGHSSGFSHVFKQALPRVPRLMGLDLQMVVILVVAVIVAAVAAAVAPVLLIPVLPALMAGALYAIPVVSVAYVVAAAGPSRWSLPYAAQLVRGRFWRTLGRMLLVLAAVIAISMVVGVMVGFAGMTAGPSFQFVLQVIQGMVGTAIGIVSWVTPAIIYHDLGGELG